MFAKAEETQSPKFALEHHISKRAGSRTLTHFSFNDAPEGLVRHPNPILLGPGCPHAGFFPIEFIDIHLVDEPFQGSYGTNYHSAAGGISPTTPGTANVATVPRTKRDDTDIAISDGLQYSAIEGMGPILRFSRDLITRCHKPAYDEWDVLMTNGASSGLAKAADLLLNPGDTILVEEFTFTPFLANIKETGGVPIPVKLTVKNKGEGIDIAYLADLLGNWTAYYPDHPKPKVLYTIPTGQNPLGITLSLETRKAIYTLAQQHDLTIIEDDPYGYISLPSYEKVLSNPEKLLEITIEEYLKTELAPSYLTLDTEGRVLRVETFSKLFGPGLRLGFIVAHKRFSKVMAEYSTITTRSPSGPSQFLVNSVAQKLGGVDGWLQWILKVRAAYAHRKKLFLDHLYSSPAFQKGYLTPIEPAAGMFISVILNIPETYSRADYPKLTTKLGYKSITNGVAIVLGKNMAFSLISDESTNFVRLTFASVQNDEELVEAVRRFTLSVEQFGDEL
ncbi:hypothetical protein BABINDRAFT_36812 [Babjeviella inositovora NRRL Y-12698]|uniref:Aminotransferase class I/classII large domain-containing protein n=1 Tax=Babjeviella inositovora NRRL Y-12698 TaxID=984486 RepID=A0A1E3QQK6_9ASCO|nr:uncharacterized protein BABINDRAFT_36812 [Babjeviella inositovora NRRL Y-12698]ODQ79784.1 hypothetical protein BABINDRAFT_36812 [Babjeviella inositovora NRRL Y-12698]